MKLQLFEVNVNKGDKPIASSFSSSSLSIFSAPILSGSLLLVGTLFLLVLLVMKEVVCASSDPRLQKLSSALNISLVPLLCAFFLVLIIKIGEVLR